MSLSPRRGRSRRGGAEEGEHDGPDERWMASYMDMVTVLMCMFIVLFAMSVVDQDKFEALKNSLATGFGAEPSEHTDLSTGVVVPPEMLDEEGEGFAALDLAETEVDNLVALREQIRANLAAQGLEQTVDFTIDERGLTVRLVGSETFFDTNRVEITAVAGQVLGSIGPVLAGSKYAASVEGHADGRASQFPYATNWELSSGRATAVLRSLVEVTGMPGERISAVGFGSARPLIAEITPEEQALNRRVDIVVLSDQPEAVRALFAGILAQTDTS